jgi:hypothetical protein
MGDSIPAHVSRSLVRAPSMTFQVSDYSEMPRFESTERLLGK